MGEAKRRAKLDSTWGTVRQPRNRKIRIFTFEDGAKIEWRKGAWAEYVRTNPEMLAAVKADLADENKVHTAEGEPEIDLDTYLAELDAYYMSRPRN
jgi:hypothetical protein